MRPDQLDDSSDQRSRRRTTLLGALGWALGIVFLVIFWQQLVDEPVDWAQLWSDSDKTVIVLAGVAMALGQSLRSQLGRAAHQLYDLELHPADSYRAWFLSQVAKYLPGSVWLFPARVVFYRKAGTATATASAIVTWELIVLLLSALVVVATSFSVDIPAGEVAALAALAGIGATVLLLSSRLRATASTWSDSPRWQKLLDVVGHVEPQRRSALVSLAVIGLGSWVITGLAFWWFVDALAIAWEPGPWEATVVFATAWISGFLVVFAPAGLGAREGVMTALVAPAIGAGPGLVLAVAARAWTSAVELVNVLVAVIIRRRTS